MNEHLAALPGITLLAQGRGLLQNTYDLTLSLKTAQAFGDWSTALQVFQSSLVENASCCPNITHFQQLVTFLLREDLFEKALKLVEIHPVFKKNANVTQPQLISLNESGSKFKTYKKAKSSPKTTKIHPTPLQGKSTIGSNTIPAEIYDLYHRIIHAYTNKGAWASALRVVDQMRTRNALPNASTYRYLIEVHGNVGHWEKCLSILNDLEGKVPHLPAATYAATINALESAGKHSYVRNLLLHVPKVERDDILTAYANLIRVWSSHHKGHKSVRHG